MISDVEHIFHVPIGHLYIFFGKNVYFSAYFLIGLFFFFNLELCEFFVYCGSNPLLDTLFANSTLI